ncbi:MAG TPA: hypothetical protein VGT42_02605, partial [Gammaproteobacteria bacterium]|nr:hypothetical protein [Gammaproteobacteria bacterium]
MIASEILARSHAIINVRMSHSQTLQEIGGVVASVLSAIWGPEILAGYDAYIADLNGASGIEIFEAGAEGYISASASNLVSNWMDASSGLNEGMQEAEGVSDPYAPYTAGGWMYTDPATGAFSPSVLVDNTLTTHSFASLSVSTWAFWEKAAQKFATSTVFTWGISEIEKPSTPGGNSGG